MSEVTVPSWDSRYLRGLEYEIVREYLLPEDHPLRLSFPAFYREYATHLVMARANDDLIRGGFFHLLGITNQDGWFTPDPLALIPGWSGSKLLEANWEILKGSPLAAKWQTLKPQ